MEEGQTVLANRSNMVFSLALGAVKYTLVIFLPRHCTASTLAMCHAPVPEPELSRRACQPEAAKPHGN